MALKWSSWLKGGQLRFLSARIRERLWVRPLLICLLSMAGSFLAILADLSRLDEIAPEISLESIESLLSVMASSMLVIATFAVASMVSAYASASSNATPRAFSLVIADDVSQNALSTFIGAFIFSIVALTTAKNDLYGEAGLFTLFIFTGITFAVVIFTFVRWVDRIARLGRLGMTIEKVEAATMAACKRRLEEPNLLGIKPTGGIDSGDFVFPATVGYVQTIDMDALQALAAAFEGRILILALPGTFAAPGRPLARLNPAFAGSDPTDHRKVAAAFHIGAERTFDDDPRFGLVVLAEIAGRALSPAVNDPGTAIGILGRFVRIFARWGQPPAARDVKRAAIQYDRIEVPDLEIDDLFDDAFTAIARDGAGSVEVGIRLQKTLHSLAMVGHPRMAVAARRHSRLAFGRAELALPLPDDLQMIRELAAFSEKGPSSEG